MTRERLIVWLITLLFIGLGFGGTALNWQMILTEGNYYPVMAFFAPFMGFLGLAMLVAPPALPEGIRENAYAARRRWLRQRLAMTAVVLGLVAAGVNLALMNGWIGNLVP